MLGYSLCAAAYAFLLIACVTLWRQRLSGSALPAAESKKNKVGVRLCDRTTRAAKCEMDDRGCLEGWEDEVCWSTRLPR